MYIGMGLYMYVKLCVYTIPTPCLKAFLYGSRGMQPAAADLKRPLVPAHGGRSYPLTAAALCYTINVTSVRTDVV